jgi:hypothetical protein
MDEISDQEKPQKQQRPKKKTKKKAGYDFFDCAGKDVGTILKDMDDMEEDDWDNNDSTSNLPDKQSHSFAIELDSDSDKGTSPKREKIECESDVVSVEKRKRESTPPLFDLSYLKESVAIKVSPKVSRTSRLRLEDIPTSQSKIQLLVKVDIEKPGIKSIKIRIFDDVQLKDVFSQVAAVHIDNLEIISCTRGSYFDFSIHQTISFYPTH